MICHLWLLGTENDFSAWRDAWTSFPGAIFRDQHLDIMHQFYLCFATEIRQYGAPLVLAASIGMLIHCIDWLKDMSLGRG